MNPNIPNGGELLAGIAAIPLIIGLVEAAKGSFLKGHEDTWAPWFAIILGLVLYLGYALATGTSEMAQLAQAGIFGLAAGLSASGLYSGVARPAVRSYKAAMLDKFEHKADDVDYLKDTEDPPARHYPRHY